MINTSTKQQEQTEILEAIEITDVKNLVVFNDNVNTFEHVIETLINVCRHSQEQAEQCTWIIHHKGKCTVKNGPLEELNPMKQGIVEKGIDARII